MGKVKSILYPKADAVLQEEIPVSYITNAYAELYGMDVGRYLIGQETIKVYKCENTGLRFYYPRYIGGDAKFYEHLQNYEWYYEDEKWEYSKSLPILQKHKRLLEIGCGNGAFLKKAAGLGVDVTGLEINENAVFHARSLGLEVLNESVENHAVEHEGYYDIVCSFQVMEHIEHIHEMIQSSVKMLRKHGILVICVPDNDSLLNKNQENVLNMPPHHLNLWQASSLASLQSVFQIKLIRILHEPLQSKHFDIYYYLLMRKLIKSYGALGKIVNLLTTKVYRPFLRMSAKKIKGHSIMAIYEKIN